MRGWLTMLPCAALLLLLVHVFWRAVLVSRTRTRLCERAQQRQRSHDTNDITKNVGRRDGILLAQRFHAPLYWLSGLLLLLRVVLYALVGCGVFAGTDGAGDNSTLTPWKASTFFWLLEMPSVLLVAIYGYLVLFYASVAYLHRWPTAGCSSWVSVAFVSFCALLSLLVTLFACLRGALVQIAQQHKRRSTNSATQVLTEAKVTSMHAMYSALVWGVLALLLLKYQAKCTQFLWRERRQHRLRALNATNLHAMAVGSTLLASVLLLRALVTLLFVHKPCNPTSESVFKELLVQYVGWELVVVAVLLNMLSKIPIAYNYPVAQMTPPPRGTQLEIVFHVPKLRDLVHDFVATTSHSLQQRARLERYDRLFFDEAAAGERGDRHSLSLFPHSVLCTNCDHSGECEECEGSSLLGQAHVALLSSSYPVGRCVVVDEEDSRGSLLSSEDEADDEEINTLPLYFG